MKVKICGLTTADQVKTCINNGANYCGFILNYPKSHRYIQFAKAKELTNINNLRVAENRVVRKAYATVNIDGCEVKAPVGEILAVTLFVNRKLTLKFSSKKKEPRGFFCLMGSCQECLVQVNDRIVTSCQVVVEAGIIIKTGINK